jgi:hypothetical protein
MKKQTLKIFKYEEITIGYAWIDMGEEKNNPLSEKNILNTIIEFSKDKNITIYDHKLRKEWVKNDKYEPTIVDGYKYPKGDETYYLDIYYQDK